MTRFDATAPQSAPSATGSALTAKASAPVFPPFDDAVDRADREAAARGLIARPESGVIRDADGTVIWDNDSYAFLDAPTPPTANPSLWRQCQLNSLNGLFEVIPGIYQVRGFDISNVTFVEGPEGLVIIDPLLTAETAAAAYAPYREHRGDLPLMAVIYTHSHVHHFGGVRGVVDEAKVRSGEVAILAPEGFTHHAVAENVYAGTAMARRAGYMYGAVLDRGPAGQVGAGLGQTTSTGEVTLLPPTEYITTTGEERTLGGIRMVFQMAPDSEAPAEMLIHFPDLRRSARPRSPAAPCTTCSRCAVRWSGTPISGPDT